MKILKLFEGLDFQNNDLYQSEFSQTFYYYTVLTKTPDKKKTLHSMQRLFLKYLLLFICY